MAVNYGINIANGEIIGATDTTLFTSPTTILRAIITQARLINYSAGAITVDLYILLSGESVSDEFKALASKSIAADETYLISEIIGNSLPQGATIVASASSAASISFSATATQVTS